MSQKHDKVALKATPDLFSAITAITLILAEGPRHTAILPADQNTGTR